MDRPDPQWTQTQLEDGCINGEHSGLCWASARIDAVKPSTRRRLVSRLEIAREHLDRNDHREVSLAELALVAGVSKYHLARLFRAVYGQPPRRYHREMRLQRAAEQLAFSVGSATSIAERFGFLDLGAFSRAFKRRYSSPPGCFRLSAASAADAVGPASALDKPEDRSLDHSLHPRAHAQPSAGFGDVTVDSGGGEPQQVADVR